MGAHGRGVPGPRRGRGRDPEGSPPSSGGAEVPGQRTAATPRSGAGAGRRAHAVGRTEAGRGARTGSGRAGPGHAGVTPSDRELVARIRRGDEQAYAELHRRHAEPVLRYARSCCRDDHTAEDLTREVFARTLQALRRGAGPDTAVRMYLLAGVRQVAASWGPSTGRERLVDEFFAFVSGLEHGRDRETGEADDPGPSSQARALRVAERTLVMKAFRSLPEHWQTVLWHTVVENEPPGTVAPHLGLSAGATAVLVHRAREGLRRAYVQAHVDASLAAGGDCARFANRLGLCARGGLRVRAARGLRRHLSACPRCRAVALEVRNVQARLRALLPVAVIGWFAPGYAVGAARTDGAGVAAGSGSASRSGAETEAGTGASRQAGHAGRPEGRRGLGRPGVAARACVATAAAAVAATVVFVLTSGDGAQDRTRAQRSVSAPSTPPAAEDAPGAPDRQSRESGRPRTGAPSAAATTPAQDAGFGSGRTNGANPPGGEGRSQASPQRSAPPGPMRPSAPSARGEAVGSCNGVEIGLATAFTELSTVAVTLAPEAGLAGERGTTAVAGPESGTSPLLVCS